ncbi:unnamed protein product [Arabis nemorensis]|uniref:Uncharacterized protein n=1 Tax=Arabis nemorensis TaxID=586526 RepID=A0A565CKK5_9BRAS|nr:unnamed protein product [Arabis nemorensis]
MEFVGLLCKLLLKYSAHTSYETSPVKTYLTAKLPKQLESQLSSYISACQQDPDLKSFDSSLHQRTSKLFSSLASRGGKTENSSLDSLKEVCEFLVDLSQDVVKIIIEGKEDVSKNQELKSLVDLYFESTNKTLDLFNTVEKCVEKAEISQLVIRVAIQQFETESMDTDFVGNKKKKYAETLKELNKVKAMGDPFGDEFTTQYESVYKEQVMLLDKIRELQVMLEKKHKNVKKLRRLGNIIFATALLSVITLSLIVTSPVVATVAIGLATPIATAGTWVIGMLKDSEKSVKTQKHLFLLTENSTQVNIESMKTIKNLVETLVIRISSILKTVEVAVEKREEEAMKLVMQEIIKKVEGFAEKIEQVGANVAKCSKVVVSGRVLVMEHIANSASLNGNCIFLPSLEDLLVRVLKML